MAAQKRSIDSDDYEWEDDWDDKAFAKWEREEEEKQAKQARKKDARTARKETADE